VQELGDVDDDRQGVLVIAPELQRAGETAEQAAERCAWTLIEAAQHLGRCRLLSDGARTSPLKLWCVTRGVRDPKRESALSHAPLWGVSRIIAGERSDLWGGVVDIRDDVGSIGEDAVDRLLDLFGGLDGAEDVVSLTPEGAFAARLAQIERQAEGKALECRPDGTYLITGGLGGLGLEVARYLVDRGARRLVLVGRRGLPPRSEWEQVGDADVRARIDAVLELEALGASIRVLALDVSDAGAVAAVLAPSALDLPPIRGVVHAAGVVADALVDKTDRQDLRTTLAPKARGAMVLHRLFPPGTLDFFTMFSSCGQLARLTGQASYAAANSFLDGLAALRHAGGHTETTSLAWAQWRGTGMGETTAGTTILEAEARGLGGISSGEAFRAWSFAHCFHRPNYAILRVLSERSLPVFSGLLDVAEADGSETGAGPVDWARIPDEDFDDWVLAEVHEQVAAELNLAAADIEIDRPLVELGVDSVMTVGLRVRLHRRFGVDLPPTILWSSPTVRALAEFLVSEREPASDRAGEVEAIEAVA
jgi:6-methylsalicylic acid synthase